MTAPGTIKRRLLNLERSANILRASIEEQIEQAALRALSDEDFNHLRDVIGRGEPISASTPQEQSAIDRYGAEYAAAAKRPPPTARTGSYR